VVLRKEIIISLEREMAISKHAIDSLKNRLKVFENKYKISTDKFLKKFNKGESEDREDFFKWHAFASALEEWEDIYLSLKSTLS